MEEYAVKVVVVILAGMGENYVKVLACFGDDRRQTDNFWACAYDNKQFEFTVVLKMDIGIIGS